MPCLPDPFPAQGLKEGFSLISQTRSWPNCGRRGSGARGGRNSISRLAIWLGDGGEPRLAASAAWSRGALCRGRQTARWTGTGPGLGGSQ